jgi:fructose-1,6-bisphosphatase/inositol monophosphatase family enzyme
MADPPVERVAALLREVGATIIMPRFRALKSGEIEEKSPDDFVTVADHEAEAALVSGLQAILPSSTVIGEEMCHARPELMQGLHEVDGPLWFVDPLDGTRNFVGGYSRFAIMVALRQRRETVGAWILRPVDGSLAVAERGAGAFIDGARMIAPAAGKTGPALRGTILTNFLPPELRERIVRNSTKLAEVVPASMCAGEDYPAVARGALDFVAYWRGLPWDHVPGALFLTEAGGSVTRYDGSPFQPDGRLGVLAAGNADIAEAARRTLELG